MSENITPEAAIGDREVKEQTEHVNKLLHDLENGLDKNQHAVATELLAERAVLAAMRTRAEMDELKKNQTAATETTAIETSSTETTEGEAII